MIEKLITYLERRPRAVLAAALTFVLALSGVSGLCFYVLTFVIEEERRVAAGQIEIAERNFKERTAILSERAQISAANIQKISDTFSPLLKSQVAKIEELKKTLYETEHDERTILIVYAKLSEIEYRLIDLESRLSAEKAIAERPSFPNTDAGPSDWLTSYVLRWLTKWTFIIAGVSLTLVYGVLRNRPRKKPNKAPEPTATAVTPPAAQEPRQP